MMFVRRFSTQRPLTKEIQERTFLAIKPDGVQRGLMSDIMKRFESKGWKLLGCKMVVPTRELAEQHYLDHKDKHFYERVCVFLSSGPMLAMAWEGRGIIKASRAMIGPTEPLECAPGTIRGDYGAHWRRNLVHGSDSVENAEKEISLWFREEELISWDHNLSPYIYELPNVRTKFTDPGLAD